MRLKAFVCSAIIAALMSVGCLPVLASDWDWDDTDWTEADSDWGWDDSGWSDTDSDWDWDDSGWSDTGIDWGWGDAGSTGAGSDWGVLPAITSPTVIPEYPGALDGSSLGVDEPVEGTLRSVRVTQESVIRVAGYYQWQLGLVPVEIRPFEYVIQMQDPMTGVFTIVVIRPWSEAGTSAAARVTWRAGAMIEVINALTPHAGLLQPLEGSRP